MFAATGKAFENNGNDPTRTIFGPGYTLFPAATRATELTSISRLREPTNRGAHWGRCPVDGERRREWGIRDGSGDQQKQEHRV